MGSWSVYCGISNITIESGRECCIVPIKLTSGYTDRYTPAALPIYGKYDDYGGLAKIKKDANTELLEEHTGLTIEELVTFLVDGKHTYNREEVLPIAEKLKSSGKYDELIEWQHAWVDKDVYEAMSTYYGDDSYHRIPIGNKQLLTELGFEKIDEFHYRKGNFLVITNGKSLNIRVTRILKHKYQYSLEDFVEIPESKKYLAQMSIYDAWYMLETYDERMKLFAKFFDIDSYALSDSTKEILAMAVSGRENSESASKTMQALKDMGNGYTFASTYFDSLETFAPDMAKLANVTLNLMCMSSIWKPNILYVTPQCGMYEVHQKLLDKFAQINQKYIRHDY